MSRFRTYWMAAAWVLAGCYDGVGSSGVDTESGDTVSTSGSSDDDTAPTATAPTTDDAGDGTGVSDAGSASDSSDPGSTGNPASSTATSDSSDSAVTDTAGSTSDSGTDTSGGGSTTGMSVSDCTALELELIDLVNAYRGENGLAPIPASPSLCIVGHSHAEDLAVNAPHADPDCNLHSWSNAGPWSACCYTDDHAQAQCMWIKPTELTEYPGYGYENAAGGGGNITPQVALDLWKNSPGHNAVILNEGTWSSLTWGAMGAGIFEGYAVLWFGEEPDPAG